MRRFVLPTEQEPEQGEQTVSFQIANGNKRQACSLKTKFPTQTQALRYLRQHWTLIEKMARHRLEADRIEDGQVRLEML